MKIIYTCDKPNREINAALADSLINYCSFRQGANTPSPPGFPAFKARDSTLAARYTAVEGEEEERQAGGGGHSKQATC